MCCKLIIHWTIFNFQIVHWKNHLRFPTEARLSLEAKNLICRLLCDAQNRLGSQGAEQIKASTCPNSIRWIIIILLYNIFFCTYSSWIYQVHPWFKGIDWDKLYEMNAAYKPEVNDELDTQNFIKFDEVFIKDLSLTLLLLWSLAFRWKIGVVLSYFCYLQTLVTVAYRVFQWEPLIPWKPANLDINTHKCLHKCTQSHIPVHNAQILPLE